MFTYNVFEFWLIFFVGTVTNDRISIIEKFSREMKYDLDKYLWIEQNFCRECYSDRNLSVLNVDLLF